MIKTLITGMSAVCLSAAWGAEAPAAYGATPTPQQVDWQRLEYYGFVHLGLNTWTGREWGYGDEDPKLFNPTNFDADKIVKLFKDAGMKGLILTAKHHDGFCSWPTKTTEHNITKSPWKDGKGNLVAEFAKACKKQGIKFGIYISPWDRNHKDYAKPGYIKDYYEQIKELLTGYGPVFEIWFDGANGGDGYYGGTKESRTIPKDYYNFPQIVKNIRALQPNCIIWGAGSVGDARWGGSEAGHVGYPHWHTLSTEKSESHAKGVPHGDRWVPAEGDTSIRSGWFWHERFNNSVKSPEKLLKVWLECVGRGANLILNVPPDRSGTIYPADAKSLLEFKSLRDRLYAKDYALGAKTEASNVRGKDKKFGPQNLIDNNIETYWTTDEGTENPSVELTFPKPVKFDVIRLREQIRLGQRVEEFKVENWDGDKWVEILKGGTIGNQAMLPLAEPVTSSKLRLTITKTPAVPCISELSLFLMPKAMPKPDIKRQGDEVSITAPEGSTIYYTTDNTDPTDKSAKYSKEIPMPHGGIIKARIIDAEGNVGPVDTLLVGLSKKNWKTLGKNEEEKNNAKLAIDDDWATIWEAEKAGQKNPATITIEMDKPAVLGQFSYVPRQDGETKAITDQYKFETSQNGKDWAVVAEGEFSNIKASPDEQFVELKPIAKPVKFFRFTSKRALDSDAGTAAEISVYPAKKAQGHRKK